MSHNAGGWIRPVVANASSPALEEGQQAGLSSDLNGALRVTITGGAGSGGTSSNFNSAFPGAGTAVGATDGTSMKPLNVDPSGNLKVTITGGAGSGGTSVVDKSAFTEGSGGLTPIGGEFNDSATSPASGQAAAVRITPNRAMHVDLRRQDGTEVGTLTAPVRTDPTGTTTQPVSGTVTTAPPANASANITQVGGSAVALGQHAMAASLPVAIASDQGNVPVSGTVSVSGTVTTSGTVTANVGTTNGLALDTTVAGQQTTAGSTSAPSKIGIIGGKTSDGTPQYQPLPLTNSGAAVKVDASATTQPVSGTVSVSGTVTTSGTVTANIGTTNGVALDATLTGGSAKSILRGGQKGTTNTNADITHTASGTNHECLDVILYDASGNPIVSFGGGTQYADGTTQATPTGTAMLGKNASNVLHAISLDSGGNLNVNVAAGGASGGTSSSFGSATPATGTAAGFSDGTNMQAARVFDADTGAGTQYLMGVNLRKSASGGSAELLGQSTMAGSLPVAIASDQGAVPVSGTVTANAGSGTFTVSGSVSATQSGTWTTATNADGTTGSAVPSKGLLVQGSDGTNARNIATTTSGLVKIDLSGTAANATAIKVDNSAVTQPVSGTVTANAGTGTFTVSGTVAATQSGAWAVTQSAATSGGATPAKLISAATTNATSLKSSAGQVYSVQAFNLNAAARYLKFYDKASAPTVGTDTPVKVLLIPGNTAGAGLTFSVSTGIQFSTGIAYAITGGIADSDTTTISASEVVVNIDYK